MSGSPFLHHQQSHHITHSLCECVCNAKFQYTPIFSAHIEDLNEREKNERSRVSFGNVFYSQFIVTFLLFHSLLSEFSLPKASSYTMGLFVFWCVCVCAVLLSQKWLCTTHISYCMPYIFTVYSNGYVAASDPNTVIRAMYQQQSIKGNTQNVQIQREEKRNER